MEKSLNYIRVIANSGNCDGDCDTDKPYEKCSSCEAGYYLNKIGSLIREAVESINKKRVEER